MLLMLLPLRAISASASAMSAEIQNSLMSWPWLEHAPVDLVAGGFLDLAGLHHQAQRHQHVLVREGEFLGLGKGAAAQECGREGCALQEEAPGHGHLFLQGGESRSDFAPIAFGQ
jgi:hypothetical protein